MSIDCFIVVYDWDEGLEGNAKRFLLPNELRPIFFRSRPIFYAL